MFDWPARIKTLSGFPCAEAVGADKQQTAAIKVSTVRCSFLNGEAVMDVSWSPVADGELGGRWIS
jgi:hypothetical protein